MLRDYVFVEYPPLATTATELLATKNYSTLRHPLLWPNQIVGVGTEVVHFMQDGVDSTVIIIRVTHTTYRVGATGGMARTEKKGRLPA